MNIRSLSRGDGVVIGAAVLRSSVPLILICRESRCVANSGGLHLGGNVRMTAERTVSSMRENPDSSACQQASTRSA